MPKILDRLLHRKPKQIELEDYLLKIKKAGLDEQGHELVSSVPMQPPLGYKKQPSLAELVREMVQSEALAQRMREEGAETLEEFEDFDVEDEPELMKSPWENQHDPSLAELQRAGEEQLRERERQATAGGGGGAPPPQSPPGGPGREAPAEPPSPTPQPAPPPAGSL